VAALFIALWSPAAVLAGPAGLLADGLSPARLLTACSLVAAALCCVLAVTDALAPLLVLTALLGCVNAVAHPAEFALVPLLAGPRALARANGHVEASRYAGFMLGPALGGLLAAGGGAQVALLADAGTFLALAAAGVALARRARVPAQREAPGRARDGIVLLARDADLRLAVGVVFVSLLFMTATPAAMVVFATESLDVGERGYGLLMALWTAGMATGALGLARRVPPGCLAAGALVAVAIQGAGMPRPACGCSLRSRRPATSSADSLTARRTCWSVRSSTSARRSTSAAAPTPHTTGCATGPRSSRSRAAEC
jgi:hypothetical protein